MKIAHRERFWVWFAEMAITYSPAKRATTSRTKQTRLTRPCRESMKILRLITTAQIVFVKGYSLSLPDV